MRALWGSLEAEGFPEQAVEHIKSYYYNSPRAYKLMECYVYDSGNLHQTTTSRNEGSHTAFRSNAKTIPNITEAYRLRQKYNMQWMSCLRQRTIHSQNRPPLDMWDVPELKLLIQKVSIFALTEIRHQISQARREVAKGNSREWIEGQPCECHTYRRYGLPCWHMVPIDGTPISLEHISPFWRIDNWGRRTKFSIKTC